MQFAYVIALYDRSNHCMTGNKLLICNVNLNVNEFQLIFTVWIISISNTLLLFLLFYFVDFLFTKYAVSTLVNSESHSWSQFLLIMIKYCSCFLAVCCIASENLGTDKMRFVYSCGGNLLMNVGPTGDGRIAPIFEERLRQFGSWMSVNEEAVYATRPWRYQNDTMTPDVWYAVCRFCVFISAFW